MGLSSTTIRFPQGFPTFSAIKRQYETQTGLDIALTARIHLPETDLADLADLVSTPFTSQILPLLTADAAAVQQLRALYTRETGNYEARDKVKQDRLAYNHIHNVELAVSSPTFSWYGHFYSVELTTKSDTIIVWQYYDQKYAIESLLKVLVDLGGEYLGFSNEAPQPIPKRWSKLKQWKDYKWYNRPKK